jgi:hypothetical protein
VVADRHAPPTRFDGSPAAYTLAAGTTLWRVHSRRYGPHQFNPCGRDDHFGGGRFDSVSSDPYPYYYASLTETTALTETLLRGLLFDDKGYRMLQRHAIEGRCVSAVRTTRPLFLVNLLTGTDLAAAAQDEWLIKAEGGAAYTQTRAVGRWLRGQAEWGQGFIWSSLRDPGSPTLVLFGDRCRDPFEKGSGDQVDLDDEAGAKWLAAMLAPYRVTVRPPGRRRPRPS